MGYWVLLAERRVGLLRTSGAVRGAGITAPLGFMQWISLLRDSEKKTSEISPSSLHPYRRADGLVGFMITCRWVEMRGVG